MPVPPMSRRSFLRTQSPLGSCRARSANIELLCNPPSLALASVVHAVSSPSVRPTRQPQSSAAQLKGFQWCPREGLSNSQNTRVRFDFVTIPFGEVRTSSDPVLRRSAFARFQPARFDTCQYRSARSFARIRSTQDNTVRPRSRPFGFRTGSIVLTHTHIHGGVTIPFRRVSTPSGCDHSLQARFHSIGLTLALARGSRLDRCSGQERAFPLPVHPVIGRRPAFPLLVHPVIGTAPISSIISLRISASRPDLSITGRIESS